MINLFDAQPRPDAAHLAMVKSWVVDTRVLDEDVTVMVMELR